jgi:hypothetical protein
VSSLRITAFDHREKGKEEAATDFSKQTVNFSSEKEGCYNTWVHLPMFFPLLYLQVFDCEERKNSDRKLINLPFLKILERKTCLFNESFRRDNLSSCVSSSRL